MILGAGESGVGTAILAKKMRWNIFLSDFGKISNQYKEEIIALGIEWEEGKHTAEKVLSADLIVKSPGIPDTVNLIVTARKMELKSFQKSNLQGITTLLKQFVLQEAMGKQL